MKILQKFLDSSEQAVETLKKTQDKEISGIDNTGRKRLLYNIIKIGSGFAAGLLLMALIFGSAQSRTGRARGGRSK